MAPSSLPWTQAFVLVSPTAALLVAAYAFGAEGALGGVLLVTGLGYLLVDVALLQPWMARQRAVRLTAVNEMISWYGCRLATCARISDVAAMLATANQLMAGSERVVLIVGAGRDAEIHGGGEPARRALEQAPDSVEWLRAQRQVVYRRELDQIAGPAVLMDRLGCPVALPLCDGGVAIGLALVEAGRGPFDEAARHAYRWLGTATATALARICLAFDMREALELVGIVDYARATQEALMPDDRGIESQGFRLRGISRPAAQCGGDLWAWRDLGAGRVLVVIGDVTGHGVVPAVIAATAAGAIHASAFARGAALDPATLLYEINRSLYRVARARYMMTAFAAIVDHHAGVIHYANAGQNFPYLITPAAGDGEQPRLKVLVARGPMLGSGREARFENHRHPLAPGDKLFLYTDGIVEAQIAKNHTFGERRLRQTLRNLAGAGASVMATGAFEEVRQFLVGRPWTDDITIVVVERPAGPGGRAA